MHTFCNGGLERGNDGDLMLAVEENWKHMTPGVLDVTEVRVVGRDRGWRLRGERGWRIGTVGVCGGWQLGCYCSGEVGVAESCGLASMR
jgi:hypothetical protein